VSVFLAVDREVSHHASSVKAMNSKYRRTEHYCCDRWWVWNLFPDRRELSGIWRLNFADTSAEDTCFSFV